MGSDFCPQIQLMVLVLLSFCEMHAASGQLWTCWQISMRVLIARLVVQLKTPWTWSTDVKLRVMGGTYIFNDSRIEITCSQHGKLYRLVLELGHSGDGYFSDRLVWKEYVMVSNNSEIIPFNLGRSTRGDGEPSNYEKDHFPAMLLRPCHPLEWLA